jgi:hypothetical protein
MAITSTRRTNDIVTTFAWDDAIETLYDSWHRRAAAAEHGHRLMAERLRRRHVLIGVATALLAALVATGAFLSLRETEGSIATAGFDPDVVLLAVGSIGALAAILAILQVALRHSTRAEGHRIAALRYETLRREMATTLSIPREVRDQPDLSLTGARLRLDRYANESPAIGQRLWSRLEAEFSLSRVPPDRVPRLPAIVIPEAPPVASGE